MTTVDDIRRYYQELCGTEHAKNKLIEELLARLEQLNQDHEKEKLDHARESDYNRQVQLRERELKTELQQVKALIDRDAFILVLIDGDGMIFNDSLIQAGESGGKEAAAMLWIAVTKFISQNLPHLSSDYKIVTRVYANLNGLGETCTRAGILESPAYLNDFARGFTGSKQLFDFVDVGSGKDRADDKISELFKLHLHNCHCKHIIFGCSHDNGYARLLEDVADGATARQITLLEGVPFEREIAALGSKYGNIKFETLFRTQKITLYPQYQPQPTRTQALPQASMQASVPMHTMSAMPPGQPYTDAHQQITPSHMPYQPYQPAIARTPSASTNGSTASPTITSWATKAIAAPPASVASPPLTPQPTSASSAISRNKYGQRVDPTIKYDMNEVKRVQKIHMCNVHFLRHDCPYGNECTHIHTYKPNKNELETLKFVARQTCCKFGTACDDVKCIYGHRCPSGIEGSKTCRFGENCRFSLDMHGIDMKVVRTTKVS